MHVDNKQVAMPVFSPTGGTFNADMSVAITCPTGGASIYYTLDGSDPSSSSAHYLAPVPVVGDGTVKTIKAIAVLEDMKDSAIATASYTIDYTRVSSPQFTPVHGTFDHNVDVTIGCATDGAAVYYTTDGTEPSVSSSLYSGPIAVSGDGTDLIIKAVAIKSGMKNSTIESSEYKIVYAQIAAPVFATTGGTFNHDISVELSCPEAGATIYYTTNGDTPTTSSPVYSAGIPVSGHGTVKTISAIAVKSGMKQSSVAVATYTISYSRVSTPQFSPAGATYDHNINVTITCATGGVTIYYTTDGSTPDASCPVYSAAVPVAGHGTSMNIKAIAIKDGMLDSTVASASYDIQWNTVAAPTINCTNSSSYTYIFKSETIGISSATSGATIYYTIDGSTPTTTSAQYTSAISISGLGDTVTVKAIAVKAGMLDSTVGQRSFTVDTRDVYIVGYSGYKVGTDLYQYAAFWKNHGETSIRDNGGYPAGDPKRIFVSGTSIYACGGKPGTAWYWLNGTMVALTGLSANGLYVNGSTVYTTGYYNSAVDPIACYWINTTRHPITTAYRSTGNGIALSGADIYVAGWNQSGSTSAVKACYWVNDTWHDLPVPVSATSSQATDIVISGADVYIAGWYNNGVNCACYWKNGVRTDLETVTNTVVTGLAVSGANAYISGSKPDAGYWLNNSWVGLNYNRAVSIAVFGSDVYVVESHVNSWWVFGIHITKNGTVVREIAGNENTPISMFVTE